MKTAAKMLSVLLAAASIFGLSACNNGTQGGEPSEETAIVKALKKNKITEHSEKIIKEPTFALDRSVPNRSDLFTFGVLFGEGMLLQGNAPVLIYGEYTKPNTGVAVEVVKEGEKGGDLSYGQTDADGKFEVWISPVEYGGPYTINVYTPESRTYFSDVLFGEVFLMSGQSNMGMTMSECLDPYKHDGTCIYEEEIARSENDEIRFLKLWPTYGDEQVDELSSKAAQPWVSVNGRTTGEMSACAYFFLKEMYALYHIPMGCIISCMGGTYTVPWIPPEEVKNADMTYAGTAENNKPSCRYNTMIYPLRKATLRGVCWYQGEGQNVKYFENMQLLIDGWRRVFDRDLKFTVVELPRYIYGSHSDWDEVRLQQKKLATLDGVTYSVNIDRGIFARDESKGIYNDGILGVDGIHCPDKELVGKRSAHSFAKAFFGAPGVLTSPELTNVERVEEWLLLTFDTKGSKLVLTEKLCGFEVSANNVSYRYATPQLVGENQVKLTFTGDAKYVRYGYTYACPEVFGGDGAPDSISSLVCLYNEEGYPVDQFLHRLAD